jgi:hypothetical protein
MDIIVDFVKVLVQICNSCEGPLYYKLNMAIDEISESVLSEGMKNT